MRHEIVLTPAKKRELESELEHLTTVERKAASERIRHARELGDLSENFEYHDAKRQQGLLESRINNLKRTLEIGHVAEMVSGAETVQFGSKVTVYDEELDETETYTIVGAVEANPSENRISNTSPLGTALLEHKPGDVVDVETPGGLVKYKITEIA
jgi:transcription elongation factor GreA